MWLSLPSNLVRFQTTPNNVSSQSYWEIKSNLPKDTKHSELSYSNSLLMDDCVYDNEHKGHLVNDYVSGEQKKNGDGA